MYAYVFTHQVWPVGAFHGAEIPYVFRNGGDEALRNTISHAWASFARTGIPSVDALPKWEPYTLDGGATMILDSRSYLSHHHDTELLDPGYLYWDE